MKRSVNLSRSATGDRRNAGKHLVDAMRALGMTDAQIAAALLGTTVTDIKAALSETRPSAGSGEGSGPASGETCPGQPDGEGAVAAASARPGRVS